MKIFTYFIYQVEAVRLVNGFIIITQFINIQNLTMSKNLLEILGQQSTAISTKRLIACAIRFYFNEYLQSVSHRILQFVTGFIGKVTRYLWFAFHSSYFTLYPGSMYV